MNPNETPVIRPHRQVVYRELAEGGVLLHLESGAYHSVNRVGWLVWTLLEDGKSLPDLLAALHERLEEVPPELGEEVTAFLESLRARYLLVAAGV